MHVFGHDDAPHGHMHIRFTNVRVPEDNILWGEGKGLRFPKSALDLAAFTTACALSGRRKRRLDLMIDRGLNRVAFGKKIVDLGKNMETIRAPRSRLKPCACWC